MSIQDLNFNSDLDCFEATIFPQQPITFLLFDFQQHQIEEARNTADSVLSWIKDHIIDIKSYAASQLLSLKNDTWLNDNEQAISLEQFVETLTLNSMSAYSEGSFSIYFNDNDIFFGHAVKVDVNAQRQFQGADIAG